HRASTRLGPGLEAGRTRRRVALRQPARHHGQCIVPPSWTDGRRTAPFCHFPHMYICVL
ncbi:hypothetical protein HAX54_032666, partial [Datura stramonium]|nr:hypothetical protein [Datura stramonium]